MQKRTYEHCEKCGIWVVKYAAATELKRYGSIQCITCRMGWNASGPTVCICPEHKGAVVGERS